MFDVFVSFRSNQRLNQVYGRCIISRGKCYCLWFIVPAIQCYGRWKLQTLGLRLVGARLRRASLGWKSALRPQAGGGNLAPRWRGGWKSEPTANYAGVEMLKSPNLYRRTVLELVVYVNSTQIRWQFTHNSHKFTKFHKNSSELTHNSPRAQFTHWTLDSIQGMELQLTGYRSGTLLV